MNGRMTEDRNPARSQVGSGGGRPGSRSAADDLIGEVVNDDGHHAQCDRTRTFRTFSDSFLSGIFRHGKLQLQRRHPRKTIPRRYYITGILHLWRNHSSFWIDHSRWINYGLLLEYKERQGTDIGSEMK